VIVITPHDVLRTPDVHVTTAIFFLTHGVFDATHHLEQRTM